MFTKAQSNEFAFFGRIINPILVNSFGNIICNIFCMNVYALNFGNILVNLFIVFIGKEIHNFTIFFFVLFCFDCFFYNHFNCFCNFIVTLLSSNFNSFGFVNNCFDGFGFGFINNCFYSFVFKLFNNSIGFYILGINFFRRIIRNT